MCLSDVESQQVKVLNTQNIFSTFSWQMQHAYLDIYLFIREQGNAFPIQSSALKKVGVK